MKEEQRELVDVAADGVVSVSNPMTLIEQAVASGVNPESLERLFDLQERWEAKSAKEKFDAAFSSFQRACPHIRKERKGAHGVMYAAYDDVMRVIQPILSDHGLSVSFDSEIVDGSMKMDCLVSGHGHTHRSSATLPAPKEMKVNDTQRMGAALSYGRRYTVCNALNIVTSDEDWDGVGLEEDITYMDDKQIFALEVMADAMEDQVRGSKKRFMAWLKNLTRCDSLTACPAKYHDQIEAKLKEKLEESK